MTRTIPHGLNPTSPDTRDFQLGAILRLPALSEVPKSFRFQTLGVKDQGDTDFCSAFSSDLASELQEGVELCPEWGFAASKQLSGNEDAFGQDIRVALKRHVKYGAVEKSLSPYTLANKDQAFLRRIENWPSGLFEYAIKHEKKSFWEITGPYDHYDNLRAAMWYFKDEKRVAMLGVDWRWPVQAYVLDDVEGQSTGHMIAAIGFEEDGIILQNSVGLEAGKDGCHAMTRAAFNKSVDKYHCFMFVALSPDEAQHMLDHGIKLDDNWLVYILKAMFSWIPFLKNLWISKI